MVCADTTITIAIAYLNKKDGLALSVNKHHLHYLRSKNVFQKAQKLNLEGVTKLGHINSPAFQTTVEGDPFQK